MASRHVSVEAAQRDLVQSLCTREFKLTGSTINCYQSTEPEHQWWAEREREIEHLASAVGDKVYLRRVI